MRLPLSSLTSDHDGRLVCIDKAGDIYRQERTTGTTYKWRRLDLTGLSPKAPRSVHARFDGRLAVLTSDGNLYEFYLTGGNRYDPKGEWRGVSLDVLDPAQP
jgi:photosystem II stability/assembly factor-like uncharacterized protein